MVREIVVTECLVTTFMYISGILEQEDEITEILQELSHHNERLVHLAQFHV